MDIGNDDGSGGDNGEETIPFENGLADDGLTHDEEDDPPEEGNLTGNGNQFEDDDPSEEEDTSEGEDLSEEEDLTAVAIAPAIMQPNVMGSPPPIDLTLQPTNLDPNDPSQHPFNPGHGGSSPQPPNPVLSVPSHLPFSLNPLEVFQYASTPNRRDPSRLDHIVIMPFQQTLPIDALAELEIQLNSAVVDHSAVPRATLLWVPRAVPDPDAGLIHPLFHDLNRAPVYVWNLPTEFRLPDLINLFSQFGYISRAFLWTNLQRSANRRHGFLTFDNYRESMAAVTSMDDRVVQGCRIRVMLYYAI